jgi:hypothetical protein
VDKRSLTWIMLSMCGFFFAICHASAEEGADDGESTRAEQNVASQGAELGGPTQLCLPPAPTATTRVQTGPETSGTGSQASSFELKDFGLSQEAAEKSPISDFGDYGMAQEAEMKSSFVSHASGAPRAVEPPAWEVSKFDLGLTPVTVTSLNPSVESSVNATVPANIHDLVPAQVAMRIPNFHDVSTSIASHLDVGLGNDIINGKKLINSMTLSEWNLGSL